MVDSEWDEAGIDSRTDTMIDVLLTTWKVPEGHNGVVLDPQEKSAGWIQVKHLVDAGLLDPGTALRSRTGTWGTGTALVRLDGLLQVDGKTFESPSGAGRHVKGSVTNGWSFWSLPDGRKLLDIRAAYTGEDPEKTAASFDWAALHAILEALPVGRWTTNGSLADAIGTAAQPLGTHVATCQQCTNAYRILTSEGTVAANFRWHDPTDGRNPMEMLQAEGILVNGRPDPSRELGSDDLQVLIEQ
jgi:alkylated DNA nucleotide flippase Atl1